MPPGEHHGGVEADDGEEPRDLQDGLNHLLADIGLGVVELGGVVPGEAGAVVAVVDVAGGSVAMVAQAEGDGGVGLVVVVVFDFDFDAAVGREVGPGEAVDGERAVPARDEPVGMLDDPGRVDAHVVGHHVAGEAEAEAGGAVAKVGVAGVSAEVFGDVVVLERVGGGDGVAVSAQALDGARGDASLPQADQPEPGDAAVGEQAELFVGDVFEAMDVTSVLL